MKIARGKYCPKCKSKQPLFIFSKDNYGQQRYMCRNCGRTSIKPRTKR